MKTELALFLLAGVAALALSGCSGSGAPPSEVSGASLHTLATDQVSAAVLFASWQGILYVPLTGSSSMNPVEHLPDGSLKFTGTNSDGSTFVIVQLAGQVTPDGTCPGYATVTWPKTGATMQSQWDAGVFSNGDNTATTHLQDTFPNGASMAYTEVDNFAANMQILRDGTAKTKSGETMGFHWDRTDNGFDKLTLNLPGPAVMTLQVPLVLTEQGNDWPVFTKGATGTYQAAGGPLLQIALTGTNRWKQWQLSAPDGTTGTFSLDPELLGQGQLVREGTTLGALRWGEDGLGVLDLIGSGQQPVSPSAAARDFQINHWIANGQALAPMPMY
jgi:hypothetical protein